MHNLPFTPSHHNSYFDPLNRLPKTYTRMTLTDRFNLIPLYPHHLYSHYCITHTLDLSAIKIPAKSSYLVKQNNFQMKLLSHWGDSQKIANGGRNFWRVIHKQKNCCISHSG